MTSPTSATGKRHNVVNGPIDNERRNKLRRGQKRRECKDDEPFEDADATGHVADQAEELGQEKRAQHVDERRRAGRQEHVEDAAASVQSIAETASCAIVSRMRGGGTRNPCTRTGSRHTATTTT